MLTSKSITRLVICAAVLLPIQASAAELAGFAQPKLTLSDSAGLPFYPTETHVFADRSLEISTFSFADQQVAAATARVTAPLSVVQDKAPAAVALRATVLRRSEDLVRAQSSQPILTRHMMPTDIMDSWSVGVFR